MLDHDITLTTTHSATPPILRLPPSVRQRIYLLVGLVPTSAYGVLDLHGHNESLHLSFHGLLVSCRTIYAEASDILYSVNRFNIHYWDKRSLEPLRNLSLRSLSNLTYLKIILNESTCHGRYEGEACSAWRATDDHRKLATQGGDEYFLSGHNAPLVGYRPLAKTLLTEWAPTIAHLSSGITAKRLELCVVCDVDAKDINTARRVVEPLSRLPQLKNCHIRLSGTSTTELNEVARHTSLKLRGICSPQEVPVSHRRQGSSQPQASGAYTGSRLLELPRELRFRILEHTDLITPWKEVTWSRRHNAFVGVRAFCATLDCRGDECPPRIHHGCQFVECWEPLSGQPCIGCFCSAKHSAFSSTCMCWTPPRDLLLVCRTLYEDSLVVFYSGNRFVIHDYDHQQPYTAPAVGDQPSRMAASVFFNNVVPEHCLKDLRFVELVFPPYSHEAWPNEAALKDWSHTISLASKRLNLPGLTIRLIMAGLDGWVVPNDRYNMTEEQGNRIIASYERIVAPIARLASGGLAHFHSSFAWPWAHTPKGRDMFKKHGCKWIMANEWVLEERCGRLVMGDRYDSLHHCSVFLRMLYDGTDFLHLDSGEPTISLWLRKYVRDA